jgi:hypothetical protein
MSAHIDCWLVWSRNTRDVVSLRAICTTNSKANLYRKVMKEDETIVEVWIEPVWLDHLFGDADVAAYTRGTTILLGGVT